MLPREEGSAVSWQGWDETQKWDWGLLKRGRNLAKDGDGRASARAQSLVTNKVK